jgi:chromosome segregation ATPase
LAYFDGLNRFYVARQHRGLSEALKVPPNVFDRFSLSGRASHNFCDKPNEVAVRARGEADRLTSLKGELESRLQRAQQDDEANGLRVAELEARIDTLADLADLQSRDASARTQQLAQARDAYDAQMAAAEEESAWLRRKLDQSEAHLGQVLPQLAETQAEAGRLVDELARQRAERLRIGELEQASRVGLETALAKLHESEASRVQQAGRIETLLTDQLVRERAVSDQWMTVRAQHEVSLMRIEARYSESAEIARTLETDLRRELTAERYAQDQLRGALELAQRELEALRTSWSWRIGRPARLLAQALRIDGPAYASIHLRSDRGRTAAEDHASGGQTVPSWKTLQTYRGTVP